MEGSTAASTTPGDPMNSLIEAAAASSNLDVTGSAGTMANSQVPQDLSSGAVDALQNPDTPDAASKPRTPSTPPQKVTIDIADTPIKTKSPWMTSVTDPPSHTALTNSDLSLIHI